MQRIKFGDAPRSMISLTTSFETTSCHKQALTIEGYKKSRLV